MSPIELDFVRSASVFDSTVFPNAQVMPWLRARRAAVATTVTQLPLDALRNWGRDASSANVVHASGKFFAIEGIRVSTDWGHVRSWDQPIINQAEIGYLGFMAKKFDGILHVLVQAKIEPGNINVVQISPTLQATKSNYTQVHQGKRPRLLEYFNGEKSVKLLLDQLQSEQGARFLRKRNRNIIIEIPVDEHIEEHPDFIWLTIGQIKRLLREDNVVNMDTRTVLSGIGYGAYSAQTMEGVFALAPSGRQRRLMLSSALVEERSFHDFRTIISWITQLKSRYELSVDRVPLNSIAQWHEIQGEIRREDGKYFSVIGVRVEIENREVVSWDQPMIRPAQEGLMAFIVRPIDGIYHFLVQAKLEAGNFDIIELAPTVQCLTGNYRTGQNEYSVPYINEVLSAPQERILLSSMQSEEGGRFFREQNRNMIVEVGDEFPVDDVSENYCWMTLNQMLRLIEFNNYLNIAARSLISAISFD
ncbi:MAG: NDP-hexose 2,3-dehydratase family protein [Burkholderiaceae bacterium]|nr:NDP-hexose 2,3-dehydratase family protein [Burkholderiaceae bacterium]